MFFNEKFHDNIKNVPTLEKLVFMLKNVPIDIIVKKMVYNDHKIYCLILSSIKTLLCERCRQTKLRTEVLLKNTQILYSLTKINYNNNKIYELNIHSARITMIYLMKHTNTKKIFLRLKNGPFFNLLQKLFITIVKRIVLSCLVFRLYFNCSLRRRT